MNASAVIDRCERLGDRCNAILVKEVRQALKSRQFVASFMLLLLVSWAGSLFGVSAAGESIEYGSQASSFFGGFFLVLCGASLVMVPFTAFRSVIEERSENTLELVQITTLAPRQIVWGKALSALVQVLVFYCAIAPFVAFTALLPGFDLKRVVFSLIMLLIMSVSYTSVAIAIGSQARQKLSQAFSSIAVIGLAIGGMVAFYSLMLSISGEIRFDEKETWYILGLILFGVVSTAFLCQQVAVAQLTFESDNRSSGMRMTVLVQWLVYWFAWLAYVFWDRSHFDVSGATVVYTLEAIYIGAASLFFTTEPDSLSTRVARSLPRRRFLRLLQVPFLPGGARGFLFGLLSLGVLATGTFTASAIRMKPGTDINRSLEHVVALTSYIVLFMGMSTWFARWLRRVMPNLKAGHILALLAVIALVSSVSSIAIRFLFRIDDRSLILIDALNPIVTMEMINDNRNWSGGTAVLLALVVVAVLAVAANLRALVRGINDVLENAVRREIEERRLASTAVPSEHALVPSSTS